MCLAATPAFLAPGVNGKGLLRLFHTGDSECRIHLDTQSVQRRRWMDRTERIDDKGIRGEFQGLEERFRDCLGRGK